MDKIDSLNQVATFHRTFKAPVLAQPTIPDLRRAQLRYELLSEELREFWEAVEANDLVGVADALCDLQYVLSGAVLEFGLGEPFVALFNEVHRSNMSKACSTPEEAQATVDYYWQKDGTEAFYEEDNGMYLVFRTTDHKTLKSVNYSPADLEGILNL
ncbi:MAG: nucleoside triphosphate pyrophosphohydrolase family protein [Cytophagaceae bacterium]|nr:nucleoside triphosphate pyrophosphohydrolase family protein [Cytophagaceae bacterium]